MGKIRRKSTRRDSSFSGLSPSTADPGTTTPLSKLTLKDCNCPICLSILVEPVSFPCKHTLCKECYGTHIEKTSLQCPLCRFRLGNWCRRATKMNSLIDIVLWEQIKEQFPEEVQARLNGEDSQSLNHRSMGSPVKLDGELASPGQIREEFESLNTQINREFEDERLKEREATNQFLRRLEEAEGPPIEVQLLQDQELAQKLQQEEEREQNGLVQIATNKFEPETTASQFALAERLEGIEGSPIAIQLRQDEELARKLQEEECEQKGLSLRALRQHSPKSGASPQASLNPVTTPQRFRSVNFPFSAKRKSPFKSSANSSFQSRRKRPHQQTASSTPAKRTLQITSYFDVLHKL